MTKIEWTHRSGTKGETWNVTVGCSKVSPGCKHCYAEKMALRLAHMALTDIDAGRAPGRKRHYLDVVDLERRCWNGQVKLVREALEDPLHWRKPRTVFVDSMSDLFHSDVPFSYINQVFDVIADAWRHTFLILTKRPDRAFEWQCQNGYMPRPNAWMGTSIEGQEHNWRIKYLLRIPSTVRFVSIEPMLGPITFDFESDTCHCGEFHKGHIFETHEFVPLLESYLFGIDWVICGGETGPGAREMNPDWARDIRDQCKATDTPFFMKQMSNRAPIPNDLLIREWPEIPS